MTVPGVSGVRTAQGPVSWLFVLLAAIFVAFVSSASAASNDASYELCESEACLKLGSEIGGRLFERRHICTDFYSFVCGAWHLTHPILRGQVRRDQFEVVKDRLLGSLKDILESKDHAHDTPQVSAAKEYHRACRDQAAIEETGLSRLQELIEGGGGFPILNPGKPLKTEKSWNEIAHHFGKLRGNPIFYTLTTTVHANRSVLTLDVPRFVLPPQILLSKSNTEVFKKNYYREMIRDTILRLVTVPITETLKDKIGAQVSSLLDFEIELAEIVMNENRGVTTYFTTVGEFQKLYKGKLDMMVHGNTEYAGSCLLLLSRRLIPKTYQGVKEHQCHHQVHWLKEIRTILHIEDSEVVHQHTPFIVNNVEYIVKLCRLLERTPDIDIVNYIYWNFIRGLLPFVDSGMKDILSTAADRKLLNYEEHSDRWQQCFRENAFKGSIYNDLLSKTLTATDSEKGLDIVNAIELEVGTEFMKPMDVSGTAMHIAQRSFLEKEIRHIAPNFYKSAKRIDRIPIEDVVCNTYLDQVLNHARYRSRVGLWSTFQMLDKDIDMDALSPQISASINDILTRPSTINFPLGSMQLPFFDVTLPEAYVFGSLGMQFAQYSSEIVHQHIQRDHYTPLRTEVERQNINCFKNQHFGQYKGEDTHVLLHGDYEVEQIHNKRVWSNKIQDAAGLNIAFKAYKKRTASRGEGDVRIPGLDSFNGDQLFFIAFANTHCESPVSGDMAKLAPWYETRKYSNADMVNMAIMNHESFGKVFQCGVGAPMNPERKCKYAKDIS